MKHSKNALVPIGLGAIFVIYVFTAAFVTKSASYTSRSNLSQMMQDIPQSEGCECWWPIWADRMAFSQTDKVVASGRNVEVTEWSAARKRFHVDANEPVTATIRSFYYPRWQAEINGSPATVESSDYGVIKLAVPAAEANVELTFREPAYVKAAIFVSIAAWLIILITAAFLILRSRLETSAATV